MLPGIITGTNKDASNSSQKQLITITLQEMGIWFTLDLIHCPCLFSKHGVSQIGCNSIFGGRRLNLRGSLQRMSLGIRKNDNAAFKEQRFIWYMWNKSFNPVIAISSKGVLKLVSPCLKTGMEPTSESLCSKNKPRQCIRPKILELTMKNFCQYIQKWKTRLKILTENLQDIPFPSEYIYYVAQWAIFQMVFFGSIL
jgi:hypothetical protein